MRIVVLGAAGQLGTEVVLHLEGLGHHEVIPLDRERCNVAVRDSVLGSLTSVRPDAVINCAAFTAVDACEAELGKAYVMNTLAVRHIAEACRAVEAHLVHLSTDYVFDGRKHDAYHEWDTTNPQSVYGRSKLAGEVEAQRLCPSGSVVRTSWVCGYHGANMVKTILRLAGEHKTLSFVDDQRGHPTFTADLAPALVRLAVERRPGLFHLTNDGDVSWYEFAEAVLEAGGMDPARVRPTTTGRLKPARPAPRPMNSVLDNAAWRFSGLPPLRNFREPLTELVTLLLADHD